MPLTSRTRKAEDLWRVTKPISLLVAVPGLYLNIMRPKCMHHSLHGHAAGLDDVAVVSTNRSSRASGTYSTIIASRLSSLYLSSTSPSKQSSICPLSFIAERPARASTASVQIPTASKQITPSTHHDGRWDCPDEQPHEGGYCHRTDGRDWIGEEYSCLSPL
jgi:hypothetical protein